MLKRCISFAPISKSAVTRAHRAADRRPLSRAVSKSVRPCRHPADASLKLPRELESGEAQDYGEENAQQPIG